MENPNLDNIVLALLFASDEPLSARKIAALIEDVTTADVKHAIETWNARADAEAWSIGIEQVAKPGSITVLLEPLYEGALDDLPRGSTCIANLYSSFHEAMQAPGVGGLESFASRRCSCPSRCWSFPATSSAPRPGRKF